ncbi:hypothetical protein A8C75_15650 [Marinobacterium aestuarii]|uniref:Uncharacterized protein n=1 Tax=Marinobacterium aestuarii TaxID=1821621 RepID=A0A1A9F0N1_9GAMM|nr:hypothetical protein [Marinobacterium aestuarii]ANG63766.1 hypothetical protein A8C75_15650 [Marinobacterium aestuarii]
MSRSKNYYYRSRLLRERIRKDEGAQATPPATTGRANADDAFALPDYFHAPPAPDGDFLSDDQGRYPRVVLWDENA